MNQLSYFAYTFYWVVGMKRLSLFKNHYSWTAEDKNLQMVFRFLKYCKNSILKNSGNIQLSFTIAKCYVLERIFYHKKKGYEVDFFNVLLQKDVVLNWAFHIFLHLHVLPLRVFSRLKFHILQHTEKEPFISKIIRNNLTPLLTSIFLKTIYY